MSLFDMKGKVAVITGSTRGIGRAIAERMAEHGAKVVISSRKQDVCDQVTKEINDKFGKGTAASIAANISSKETCKTSSTRATARSAGSTCWSATPRRIRITARSAAFPTISSEKFWTTISSPTTG